jgi:hypothetical protein
MYGTDKRALCPLGVPGKAYSFLHIIISVHLLFIPMVPYYHINFHNIVKLEISINE